MKRSISVISNVVHHLLAVLQQHEMERHIDVDVVLICFWVFFLDCYIILNLYSSIVQLIFCI